MSYAIIKPKLRLTLKHGKDMVFQKTGLADRKAALQHCFGRHIVNNMHQLDKQMDEKKACVSC